MVLAKVVTLKVERAGKKIHRLLSQIAKTTRIIHSEIAREVRTRKITPASHKFAETTPTASVPWEEERAGKADAVHRLLSQTTKITRITHTGIARGVRTPARTTRKTTPANHPFRAVVLARLVTSEEEGVGKAGDAVRLLSQATKITRIIRSGIALEVRTTRRTRTTQGVRIIPADQSRITPEPA